MNGTTALIVDDNPGMRLLARTLVEDAGGTVVAEAADGEEAVGIALDLQPQVIVMDHVMPRCDGVEATSRITARHPAARVIAWTSADDGKTAERFFAAGAAGFVLKGDVPGFERLLRRVLH